MKRWGAILMVAVVLVWAVVATTLDFKANDVIGYFSHKPGRLLYVLGIALAGGLGFHAFEKCSPGTKRKLTLVSLGAPAMFLTGLAVQIGYDFVFLLTTPLADSAAFVLPTASLVLCLASLAVLFWLEFRWFLKTGRTRWLHSLL